jgi:hypothetical protein
VAEHKAFLDANNAISWKDFLSKKLNDRYAQVFYFSLDKSDYNNIDAVYTKSNNLFEAIGDCGDEYR